MLTVLPVYQPATLNHIGLAANLLRQIQLRTMSLLRTATATTSPATKHKNVEYQAADLPLPAQNEDLDHVHEKRPGEDVEMRLNECGVCRWFTTHNHKTTTIQRKETHKTLPRLCPRWL
jgi:hypothetical protein